jgi:hypothetical protein
MLIINPWPEVNDSYCIAASQNTFQQKYVFSRLDFSQYPPRTQKQQQQHARPHLVFTFTVQKNTTLITAGKESRAVS